MSPTSFLSSDQTQSLWRLFGPETEAGRQLRRMFAPTQQQMAAQVKYPSIVRKSCPDAVSPHACVPNSEPKRTVPAVRYPSFRQKAARAMSLPANRRRPLTVIQNELSHWVPGKPRDSGKDLSVEKEKLQESFQFAFSTILPSSVAGPKVSSPSDQDIRASLSKKVVNGDDDRDQLITEIVYEVAKAQGELDVILRARMGKCSNKKTYELNTQEAMLKTRIENDIKDLNLLLSDTG